MALSSLPLTWIFTVANFSGSSTVYFLTIESLEKPATSVMAPLGMVSVYCPPLVHGASICQRRSRPVSRTKRTGTSSMLLSDRVSVRSMAAESSRVSG